MNFQSKRKMSPDNVFFFNCSCKNNGQDMVLVLSGAYFDLFCLVIRSLQVDILIKSFYWCGTEPFYFYQGLLLLLYLDPWD